MRRVLYGLALIAVAAAIGAGQGIDLAGAGANAGAAAVAGELPLTANQSAWIEAKRDELLPRIAAHEQVAKDLRRQLELWEADVKKDRDIGPWTGKGK
jgi:hypothetical protein